MTPELRETLRRSVHEAARELVGWTFLAVMFASGLITTFIMFRK